MSAEALQASVTDDELMTGLKKLAANEGMFAAPEGGATLGALRKMQAAGLAQQLVGLVIDGPRAARQEMPVLKDGVPVGKITSGTMSPTLKKCIAMAYVRTDLATAGTGLSVDCRGSTLSATVTPLPFYKRSQVK